MVSVCMNRTAKKTDQDNKKKVPANIFYILAGAAFFGCLFLYFYKTVEMHLIYQRFALDPWIVPFEPSMEFFRSFLDKPGGVLSYIESFLFQWYYFNLSGSILAILLALSAYLASYSLLAAFHAKGKHFLGFGPAIAIAVMYNVYYSMLYACLGVIIATVFAAIYVRIIQKNKSIGLLIFAITFASLYYVIAGFSLIFVLLVVIYHAVAARQAAMAFVELFIACIIVSLIGTLACNIPFKDAFLYELSFDPWVSPLSTKIFYGTCGMFLLTVLLFGLWRRFASNAKTDSKTQGPFKKFLIAAVQLALAIAIGTAALHYSSKPTNKTRLMSKYMARHHLWNDLIELGQNNPWLHKYLFFNHDHTRALFHTGRLESELFKYPQNADALLFSAKEVQRTREWFERISGLMLSMGHANSTEKNSFELLENAGNWPLVLEYLAMANLAKGQDQTASVFLNKLSKDFLHGKKARDLLKQMRKDPTLSENQRIQYLRSITVVEEDLPELGYDAADFYQLLLRKNPKNKMAFQYMMAKYLLKGQANKIAENIHRLDDFGYDKLPRYYEEALVIAIQMDGNRKIPEKWKPSARAFREGRQFLQTHAIYKKDPAAVKKVLGARYGGSYYFYAMFN